MPDIVKLDIGDEVADTRDLIKACFKGKEHWVCTVNDPKNVMPLKKAIGKRDVQPFCFRGDFPIRNQAGNIYNTIFRTERNIVMTNKTLCSFQQRFLNKIKGEEFALVMNLPDTLTYDYHMKKGERNIFCVMYEDDGLKILDNGIMQLERKNYEGYGDYFTILHDMIAREQIVYRGETYYGYFNSEIFDCFKKIYLLKSSSSVTSYEYWTLPLEEKLRMSHLDNEPVGKLYKLEG